MVCQLFRRVLSCSALCLAALSLAAALGGLASAAMAQTGPEPMFKYDTAPGWLSRNDLDVTIGAGIGVTPRFEGAKSYGLQPLPYLDITWHDRVFLSTEDGLGVNLLNSNGLYTGPFVWISDGRRSSSSNRLSGLSDVETVAIGGVFARYEFNDAFDIFTRLHRDLEQDRRGLTADFGAELDLPLTPSLIAGLKTTATWAQGAAMRPMFGITPEEAQASGYDAFSPDSGWRDVVVEPSLTVLLDDHWALTSQMTYERLLPAASRSPLVRDRGNANQVGAGLILSYHF